MENKVKLEGTRATMQGDKNERRIADDILQLRINLHREIDRLYAILQDPAFKGCFTIELSAKDGRPGEPKVTISRIGGLN